MAGESEKTSLKGLIQGFSGEGVQVVQGTVTQTGPLKIQVVNDDKLTISENITYVPWHLTDYETEVTVEWETEDASGGSGEAAYAAHRHDIVGRKKIIVHNALVVGDKVHLLTFNHGKQYFVLDRVAE